MRFRYNCATPKCLAALPGVRTLTSSRWHTYDSEYTNNTHTGPSLHMTEVPYYEHAYMTFYTHDWHTLRRIRV
jgi:hypothetical protein